MTVQHCNRGDAGIGCVRRARASSGLGALQGRAPGPRLMAVAPFNVSALSPAGSGDGVVRHQRVRQRLLAPLSLLSSVRAVGAYGLGSSRDTA